MYLCKGYTKITLLLCIIEAKFYSVFLKNHHQSMAYSYWFNTGKWLIECCTENNLHPMLHFGEVLNFES
jgi:hypothetical protein